MYAINFLFTERIPIERISWIADLINLVLFNTSDGNKEKKPKIKIKVFITGDAILSLLDKRYIKPWSKILKNKEIALIIDYRDLELLGFRDLESENSILKNISNNNHNKIIPHDFWKFFIESIKLNEYSNSFGFLEFMGPYMSRTSVHVIRALKASINNDLSPELYAYLDGVHLGHDSQRPSEFENIENGLIEIQRESKEKNLKPVMLACSRCGTARGYIKNKDSTDFIQSYDVLPSFLFCNLNKIIDKFELNHLIFSPSSISIQINAYHQKELEVKDDININKNPPIIILITHSPYGTEWTFGGISFAVACANHMIPTKVVFIEDGIYCLKGKHYIREEDGIFNIQEIIEATFDLESLEYFAYKPSLDKRGVQIKNNIEGINIISPEEFSQFLSLSPYELNLSQKRVILF